MKKVLTILLGVILFLLMIPLAYGEEYRAVVANPVITDRLNLRQNPGSKADSLGRFYSGTSVRVLSQDGEWAKVRIGNLEGYMMQEYLYPEHHSYGAPGAFYHAYISGEVILRDNPKNSGKEVARIGGQVEILGDVGDDWRYVKKGEKYGYVKTNQLKDYTSVIPWAYLVPEDGSNVVALYSDKNLKKRLGLAYEGTVIQVLEMSRAGWARAKIMNSAGAYEEESYYVDSADVNPFILPWEEPAGRRAGVLLEDYTAYVKGEKIFLPKGAKCTLTVNYNSHAWLVEYGPAGDAWIRLPREAIGYQDEIADRYGPMRQGYALVVEDVQARQSPDGKAAYGRFDRGTTLEWIGTAAGTDENWYQVRMNQDQAFLTEHAVKILSMEDLYPETNQGVLLPGQHLFSNQSQGLYHFDSVGATEAVLTLKNEEWNLDQQFSAMGIRCTVYIPAGTRAVLEGGGCLRPASRNYDHYFDEWEMAILPGWENFTGDGRLLIDEQLAAGKWWGYRLFPLDSDQESYAVLSSLNTIAGEETKIDLMEYQQKHGEGYLLDLEAMPGYFLEVHNCRMEIYWGNG